MQVHNFLGNGFQELIYQRALAIELANAGLDFQRELEMPIYYKHYLGPIGERRVDFLVEGIVIVELKAQILIEDVHLAQILNYLRVYKIEIGLLITLVKKALTSKG